MKFAFQFLGFLLVAMATLTTTVLSVLRLPDYGVEPWFGIVVGLGTGIGLGWLGNTIADYLFPNPTREEKPPCGSYGWYD